MGEGPVSGNIVPQGPMRHCGQPDEHPLHVNEGADPYTYCDGVSPLEDFFELTIRRPMTDMWQEDGLDHDGWLAYFEAEGVSVVFDEYDSPQSTTLLRIRLKGKDVVYPAKGGLIHGSRD